MQLTGFDIEGGVLPSGEEAALRRALPGRTVTVTVADIFREARDLENRVARRGAVLTRIVVPARKLGDGARLR